MQQNVITFSAAISACEARGMWTYALQLLYKLLGLQMEGGTLH